MKILQKVRIPILRRPTRRQVFYAYTSPRMARIFFLIVQFSFSYCQKLSFSKQFSLKISLF